MAKQEVQLTFTFINPNTPMEFERQFQRILIAKLLYQYRKRMEPVGRQKGAADK